MYERLDPVKKGVSDAFFVGLNTFFNCAQKESSYIEKGTMLCPCTQCKNRKRLDANTVRNHLYTRGFTENYYFWSSHRETVGGECSTSVVQPEDANQFTTYEDIGHQEGGDQEGGHHEGDSYAYVHMVEDAFLEMQPEFHATQEELTGDSNHFFQMLAAAKEPIYKGCVEGLSALSLSARIMHIKTEHNLSEVCVDAISQTFKEYLPHGNKAPESYYDTKKMAKALGMPFYKIDVCEDYCMLFWKGLDKELTTCCFCGKDRYHPREGPGTKIPKQRMFYLPIANRLKRLYQSEQTASHMRWHAEHVTPEGEMQHPSDGAAWKHFNQIYPNFALEPRNVYLGLSTDGFKPGGMHSKNHSVWPVIVTPYNLPPEELKDLWINGVSAYDVSRKQNFVMHVALMWTINSDFPAYAMLSGWSTHGRLVCPYCLEETKSFWLPNGRKHCWFDCHRAFLPTDHPYRRNIRSFRKNIVINDKPPTWLTGKEIYYERINQIEGLERTVECGGRGHENPHRSIDGYSDYHNWVKKSILWDLP
ncbi:PREDICTED: uncharacterized protein LOC109131223 [Camelina sativa]|uniref:Uncharacterized protein LOC109131223 n=1 Tax=Camelina sativa TaxID=90675 RepID=A0ABM1REM2_CAMSA|nr:PREDICTED: uncharacterized protein LOC109131223 [Camelina sativa]